MLSPSSIIHCGKHAKYTLTDIALCIRMRDNDNDDDGIWSCWEKMVYRLKCWSIGAMFIYMVLIMLASIPRCLEGCTDQAHFPFYT